MSIADDYEGNTFILCWDMYGLESCINASQLDRERIWDTLADREPNRDKLSSIVHAMTLRARFNSQRHYEIYAIDVSADITEDTMVNSFGADPQGMAELIRARGRQLYSNRVTGDIKIT